MSHRIDDHDDVTSRAYLGHTVQDNGDLTADFLDESTGEVVTETIRGYMPPVRRKDDAPFDPWDSPYWDLWHYELSDPCEVADLMAAAREAEADRRDAPPWPTVQEMAEYLDANEREATPDERAAILAWLKTARAEHLADAPDRREQVFEDWISANLRQQVSDDELGQIIGHGCV
jgi:hypothetical protein